MKNKELNFWTILAVCALGHFELGPVLSLGHFSPGPFFAWVVLSLDCFVMGRLELEPFCDDLS
jgi:hypothetical protein